MKQMYFFCLFFFRFKPQNHTIVWTGRDLRRSFSPVPCNEKGHLQVDQVAQNHIRVWMGKSAVAVFNVEEFYSKKISLFVLFDNILFAFPFLVHMFLGVCDPDDSREKCEFRKLTFLLSHLGRCYSQLCCCKVLKQWAWSKRKSRLRDSVHKVFSRLTYLQQQQHCYNRL